MKILKEVKIVKEAKKSHSLWRFACGDALFLHLSLSFLTKHPKIRFYELHNIFFWILIMGNFIWQFNDCDPVNSKQTLTWITPAKLNSTLSLFPDKHLQASHLLPTGLLALLKQPVHLPHLIVLHHPPKPPWRAVSLLQSYFSPPFHPPPSPRPYWPSWPLTTDHQSGTNTNDKNIIPQFKILLAPSGALVLMMVYYISKAANPLFQIWNIYAFLAPLGALAGLDF